MSIYTCVLGQFIFFNGDLINYMLYIDIVQLPTPREDEDAMDICNDEQGGKLCHIH